jgi:hypothetical protein
MMRPTKITVHEILYTKYFILKVIIPDLWYICLVHFIPMHMVEVTSLELLQCML